MIKQMLALAAGLMLLAGCGDSGKTATKSMNDVKVALLVTGSTTDGGWNQLAADAMNNNVNRDGRMTVTVREQVSKDAAADAIRQFDAKGYDVIICHGFEYQDVAAEVTGGANPVKIKIAVSGGNADNPNFQSLDYGLEGASYQLGVIAGRVSKSGKLAFIGGEPFPTLIAMQKGFEAGAKSVNPKATVAAQYTGWDDPSKAKKQTEAFLEQGVDVVMQDVDAASRGVFEAVKEHNAQNGANVVYTFGSNSNQNLNPVCPDYTLASAVIRLDIAFERVIGDVAAGKFKGGHVREDLASGVSVAELNPKLVGTVIDAETRRLMDEAGKKIIAGEITISSDGK